MKRTFKIFFVAQDPGGFDVILPLIKEFRKRREFLLEVILANQSRNIAKKKGINYLNGNKLTDRKLAQLLRKKRPDLIFTSTSLGKSIEKRITKIAKVQEIKIISLVDFWSNYNLRFSVSPDYILVVDRLMKKEMAEKKFNSKKLIITGNPAFDNFFKLSNKKGEIITFFSQPFSELFKKGDKGYCGFDEIQVFKDLVECLEKIKVKIPIRIKFHPIAKKLSKFNDIIKNSNLNILFERKLSTENLIKKSRIVTGMNSVVLFRAAIMNKNVLSYQPNLDRQDSLITNRLGISTAVYQKKDIYFKFKKLLSSGTKKKNLKLLEKYIKNNSTQKVTNFIIKYLKSERLKNRLHNSSQNGFCPFTGQDVTKS